MRFFSIFVLALSLNFGNYGRASPNSFADLVEDLVPAVVSIASTTILQQKDQTIPQFPEGSPFDEFFKEFFDREQRRSPSQRPLVGAWLWFYY